MSSRRYLVAAPRIQFASRTRLDSGSVVSWGLVVGAWCLWLLAIGLACWRTNSSLPSRHGRSPEVREALLIKAQIRNPDDGPESMFLGIEERENSNTAMRTETAGDSLTGPQNPTPLS